MRNTQEKNEARLDSLLGDEDAKRDTIREHFDTTIVKAMTHVADELKGERVLEPKKLTRIAESITKMQRALEDLRGPDL
jgi:hypothetical protein